MRDVVLAVADLLLGARCAGCHGPAVMLCRACGDEIRPAAIEVWPHAASVAAMTHTAAGSNTAVLRRVLIAWKEGGTSRLTEVLGHHLATAVASHLRPGRPLTLVPVPTSRRGQRRRGGDLVADLARSAAGLLRSSGADVQVLQALEFARGTRDQAGLGAAARHENVTGAFRVRPRAMLAGRDLLVVDDIVTTGSTLEEAVRALAAVGQRPVGAAVVAATPRHSKGSR